MGTQDLQSLQGKKIHAAHKMTNSLLKRLIHCNVVDENVTRYTVLKYFNIKLLHVTLPHIREVKSV